MSKYSLFFLIFTALLSSGLTFAQQQDKNSADSVFLKNKNYGLQTGLYNIYKTRKAGIVMLGNSITHGVNWSELLGRHDVVERGIPSDILQGFLNRMDYVYKLDPSVCFIMGGINDIYSGIPLGEIFKNYKEILKQLKKRNITPVIQSTLFVSPKWHHAAENNAEVEKLNKMLSGYAEENKIEFLDLNKILSENKFLADRFTHDGVHLNAGAYKLWGMEIEKMLRKLQK